MVTGTPSCQQHGTPSCQPRLSPQPEPMVDWTPFCSLSLQVEHESSELENWVGDMTTLFSNMSELCLQDLCLPNHTSILSSLLFFCQEVSQLSRWSHGDNCTHNILQGAWGGQVPLGDSPLGPPEQCSPKLIGPKTSLSFT